MAEEKQRLNAYFCLDDDMSAIEPYLDLGEHRTYRKGDALIPLNSLVDRLGYLKKGRAGRLITTASGSEKYIKIVASHGIIGEVMFFKHSISDHSFVAIEDCECYWFDRETVDQIFLRDEAIVHSLIQWFCNRMLSLNAQVLDSMLEDTYHRVCTFIEDYVKTFGRIDEDGHPCFEGKLSHYDIARYLGINRVSVTRAISRLQEAGIIIKDRRRLVVLDMDALENI